MIISLDEFTEEAAATRRRQDKARQPAKGNKLNKPQPAPTPNAGRPIWDMVVDDMRERDHIGRAQYLTPLQAGNGRDALMDAYQEALDLVVYLRQAIEERATERKVKNNP
jgi:cytochrome c1